MYSRLSSLLFAHQLHKMDKNVNESLSELMELCTACNNHRLAEDSYTAPGFMDFSDSPLNIDDIPMESYSIENGADIARNPSSVPWENSIKNFVLDIVSLVDHKIFSTCIILSEFGYAYSEVTTAFITKKHTDNNTAVLSIIPLDENNSTFSVTIARDRKVEYYSTTDREYFVSTLSVWYVPNSTLIFCHDASIDEYRDTVSMMPGSTWSISCSPTNFITTTSSDTVCTYICPVYSYPGSMETRAVGSGPVRFAGYKATNSYSGKMNYYSRCIRGCRHNSGRCYDCQVLYKLLVSLQDNYKVQKEPCTIKFTSSFLNSASSKKDSIVER